MKVQHIGRKNLVNITRNQLLSWQQELNNLYGTLLYHLMRTKITDFLTKNGALIESSINGQNAIIKEHYLTNEQGVIQIQKKDEQGEYMVDEKGQPVMEGALQEGKTHDGFNVEMGKYMNETIPFEL